MPVPSESLLGAAFDALELGLVIITSGRVTHVNRLAEALLEECAPGLDPIGVEGNALLVACGGCTAEEVAGYVERSRRGGVALGWGGRSAWRRGWSVEVRTRAVPALGDDVEAFVLSQRALGLPERADIHDLNNVMQALAIAVEASVSGEREAGLGEELVSLSRRAVRLTKRLLRPISGGAERRACDPGVVLRRIAPTARALTSATVQWDVADPLPEIALTHRDLETIVYNLLFNAADAVSADGAITVRAEAVDGALRLVVEDDGSGMDAETLSRVGQTGYTTKAEGTGLGLATLTELVRGVGGRMQLRSEPGAGTIVEVWLPGSSSAG